jgi:hypothetical protein
MGGREGGATYSYSCADMCQHFVDKICMLGWHESPAKHAKTPRLSEQGCPRRLFFVAAKPAPWSAVRIVLCGRSTLNSARRNAAVPAYASWCY